MLQNSYNSYNPWEFFQKFYYIMLGDFDDYRDSSDPLDSDIFFVILFITTLFINIVMLNLLIAIISDSFEKVMAMEKQAEVFEKLQIIMEFNSHTKNISEVYYLFDVTKEEKKEGDNLEERLRSKIDKFYKLFFKSNYEKDIIINRTE